MGQADGNPIFTIDFDFIGHQLIVTTVDGKGASFALYGQSVAVRGAVDRTSVEPQHRVIPYASAAACRAPYGRAAAAPPDQTSSVPSPTSRGRPASTSAPPVDGRRDRDAGDLPDRDRDPYGSTDLHYSRGGARRRSSLRGLQHTCSFR
jgi:hypothetical protein